MYTIYSVAYATMSNIYSMNRKTNTIVVSVVPEKSREK